MKLKFVEGSRQQNRRLVADFTRRVQGKVHHEPCRECEGTIAPDELIEQSNVYVTPPATNFRFIRTRPNAIGHFNAGLQTIGQSVLKLQVCVSPLLARLRCQCELEFAFLLATNSIR